MSDLSQVAVYSDSSDIYKVSDEEGNIWKCCMDVINTLEGDWFVPLGSSSLCIPVITLAFRLHLAFFIFISCLIDTEFQIRSSSWGFKEQGIPRPPGKHISNCTMSDLQFPECVLQPCFWAGGWAGGEGGGIQDIHIHPWTNQTRSSQWVNRWGCCFCWQTLNCVLD